MNINQILAVSLLSLAVVACSGDIPTNSLTNTPNTTTPLTNDSVTLTWTEPTVYIDGSALSPGSITKYRIYLGRDQALFDSYIEVDAASNPNSYTIDYQSNQITTATTVFITMTAIDDKGIESDLSEIINFNPN